MTQDVEPSGEGKAEIPKPKPGRDWRSFGKEYVIVVLGVATALAAQQGADWLRWRSEVAQARQIIAGEMARNISYGIARMRQAACINSRLHEIEKILADAARNGVLPPLGTLGGPPVVPWSSGAWESVVASQTATHFPRQQLASLSLSYARVQRAENWNRQEAQEWATLNRLSGPGRRFDAALGAEWQKALGTAAMLNTFIANTSLYFIRDIQGQNLPFMAADQRLMAEAKTEALNVNTCRPLSSVPAVSLTRFAPGRILEFESEVKRLPYGRRP